MIEDPDSDNPAPDDDPTDGLDLEFVDTPGEDAPSPEAARKAKPTAKLVPRKVAVTKAVTKRATAKRATAKVVTKKVVAKKAVAKKASAKKTAAKALDRKRAVATAVMNAPKPNSSTAAAGSPPPPGQSSPTPPAAETRPVPQVVAQAGADPRKLMRAALKAHGANQLAEARELYGRILRIDPTFAAAWINLGVLLRRSGRTLAAVTCLTRGVLLKPEDGAAWSNLGNALRAANRLEEAFSAQRRALELSPEIARLHYNHGLTIRDGGNLAEALRAMRRAALLGYDAPELAWDMALTDLLAGRLREGFEAYEARWALAETVRHHETTPEWDGRSLDGKTLLVWAEQGIGDSIQFCRYLTDRQDGFSDFGGKVYLEIQPPLYRLLKNTRDFKNIKVIPRGAAPPKADVQIPLMSLARLRGTRLDTIPDHCPYLRPPPEATPPKWARKDRFQVGICWAGKPTHKNDRNRSIDLAAFARLMDMPEIDFLSLQKGPATAALNETALVPPLRDLGSGLGDFGDTASAIAHLDLVITVDTSVAHLAGAMARPVWVLLPYAPDWRWMLHRDDSPWYPSMTLFRQTSPGDWDEVLTRVRAALARRLRDRRRS
jgi:tetratricopeptide (TPR) repeat protein